MVYAGFVKPNNKIVVAGNPLVSEFVVETATNMYPGRLVELDSNPDDIEVCGAAGNAIGWLGYEHANPAFRPDDMTTAYAANALAPVLYGGGFVIVGRLASGQNAAKDARLVAGANGELLVATAAGLAAGSTPVTSTAATGVVTGSVGAQGMIVAIAMEAVDASSAAANIVVRSLI
jgi:hypothetical protein